MSSDNFSNDEGAAGSHSAINTSAFLVAPTVGSEFNTLGLDIVPVACVSLQDVLFKFDSSFPLGNVANMLRRLPTLRDAHRRGSVYPPLSIFGHADPVGKDDYNKALSGRRARAIYALLTHNLTIWDDLYNTEWSCKNVLPDMRQTTNAPSGQSRRDLMQAYMNLLFPNKLDKTDFLGRGTDERGKADYQGCGEFNALRLLSTHENSSLPSEKRNRENQPNRRVVVYLFSPGLTVNASLWPCPRASEGDAGCRARFFGPPKSGDQRRKAGPVRREYAETQDTFACRFYHRLAARSPCEILALGYTYLDVRLLDAEHNPRADVVYSLQVHGKSYQGKTGPDGRVRHNVPLASTAARLETGTTVFDLKLAPLPSVEEPAGLQIRLQNLGYDCGSPLGTMNDQTRNSLRSFQQLHSLPVTGEPDDATTAKLKSVYGQ